MRCEGFKQDLGAFSYRWSQCENEASLVARYDDGGRVREYPLCQSCLTRASLMNIKIIETRALSLEETKRERMRAKIA
jgi:hypothetical protein